MARGGLSDDPAVRRRQEEGLARGRAIAAGRRKAGLPSKKKERELEARVIEGGNRETDDGDRGEEQPQRETAKPAERRQRPRQRRRETQRTAVDGQDKPARKG